MDIEFLVQDTFYAVRPDWKLAKSLDDAGSAFAVACKDNYDHEGTIQPQDDGDADLEDGDIDGEAEPRRSLDDAGERTSDEDEDEVDDVPPVDEDEATLDTPDHETDEDEDDQIVVTRPEEERDPEADAEFDRELARMMAESVAETRKTDRKPALDIALPMRRIQQRDGTGNENDMQEENSSRVQFSLLSRRGNRPQVRCIRPIIYM